MLKSCWENSKASKNRIIESKKWHGRTAERNQFSTGVFTCNNISGFTGLNVFVFGDDALGGSNQFILLIGAAVAAIVGFRNKVSYTRMIEAVGKFKSTTGAILILLMVGALAGTWLLSGIIPAMIYYGYKFCIQVSFYLLVLSFARLFLLLEVAGRPLPQWASRSSALDVHWWLQRVWSLVPWFPVLILVTNSLL